MAQSSFGESDLLLIIGMCNEGIEKCDVREKEHARGNNSQAAEWDRQVRERYNHLKSEVLAELEQRRRVINIKTAEGAQPEPRSKSDGDPCSQ
jgi:hypothetical protein